MSKLVFKGWNVKGTQLGDMMGHVLRSLFSAPACASLNFFPLIRHSCFFPCRVDCISGSPLLKHFPSTSPPLPGLSVGRVLFFFWIDGGVVANLQHPCVSPSFPPFLFFLVPPQTVPPRGLPHPSRGLGRRRFFSCSDSFLDHFPSRRPVLKTSAAFDSPSFAFWFMTSGNIFLSSGVRPPFLSFQRSSVFLVYVPFGAPCGN